MNEAHEHFQSLFEELGEELEEQDRQKAEAINRDNAFQVLTIQLQRIYDVLLMLLTDQNPTAANSIILTHTAGRLIGPMPSYTEEPKT